MAMGLTAIAMTTGMGRCVDFISDAPAREDDGRGRPAEFLYELWDGETLAFTGTSVEVGLKYKLNPNNACSAYSRGTRILGKYDVTRRKNNK